MTTTAVWVALVAAAYLVGTFPSAIWIARTKNVDITTVGSGNPGAANIARTLGMWWGVLVFVLDGLKGAIAGGIGLLALGRPLGWAMVAASVVGHMFPATRRFRGGKGVATMGGGSFVMFPLISTMMLALWATTRRVSGKSSPASIAIVVCFPVAIAVAGAPIWEIVAVVAIDSLVLARHGANIRRLLGGRELPGSRSR
ncbi:MAG: glycerol-3-phosphate acyltransferase [Ilumatobacteraceae bacterium]